MGRFYVLLRRNACLLVDFLDCALDALLFLHDAGKATTYSQMQSPMQLLQRRYAAGEITSEEYEERQAKLLRDAKV